MQRFSTKKGLKSLQQAALPITFGKAGRECPFAVLSLLTSSILASNTMGASVPLTDIISTAKHAVENTCNGLQGVVETYADQGNFESLKSGSEDLIKDIGTIVISVEQARKATSWRARQVPKMYCDQLTKCAEEWPTSATSGRSAWSVSVPTRRYFDAISAGLRKAGQELEHTSEGISRPLDQLSDFSKTLQMLSTILSRRVELVSQNTQDAKDGKEQMPVRDYDKYMDGVARADADAKGLGEIAADEQRLRSGFYDLEDDLLGPDEEPETAQTRKPSSSDDEEDDDKQSDTERPAPEIIYGDVGDGAEWRI